MRARVIIAVIAGAFLLSIPDFRTVHGGVFILGLTAAVLFSATGRPRRR
ncbi:hypothetical protein [Micromonospora arborensis]